MLNHIWTVYVVTKTNKEIPAVTKVEGCTKAVTGVGATIATFNQEEKMN
jgi:hypothetical protein